MVGGIVIHRLYHEQTIPTPLGKVWDYFCDPENLNQLTPPDMKFEILAGGAGMHEGQLIEYRVEFIRGVRSRWLTEISHVRSCEYFVDEQRLGPYRFWYHEHAFEETSFGTKMTDRVTYAIPYGFFGDLLNRVWIGGRLDQIFEFRRKTIIELFGDGK